MRIKLALLLLILCNLLLAQRGGDNAFEFVNLPHSARYAALGGQQISVQDNDIAQVYLNPAMLSPVMDNQFSVNYIHYLKDIGVNYGYVAYGKNLDDKANLAIGLKYVNYGKFDYADATGYRSGATFNASDYLLHVSYSYAFIENRLTAGMSLKPLFSDYESYNSFGLATDLGLNYWSKSGLVSTSLVFKNVGYQLKTFESSQDRESLPFEIQMGVSTRLAHAPFRISVLARHLEKWNLTYQTEQEKKDAIDPITGEEKKKSILDEYGDNILRHLSFGLEILPSDKFQIQIGYNHKRRKELKVSNGGGTTGFSIGASLHLKKVSVSYARMTYHAAGASDFITLRFNIDELGKNF